MVASGIEHGLLDLAQDLVLVQTKWRITIFLKTAVFWDVTPCDSCKHRRFEGTSVLTRSTRLNITEDDILHIHRREKLKSNNFLALQVFELRALGRPGQSQSLYRLRGL
jgi:hypothetical protein